MKLSRILFAVVFAITISSFSYASTTESINPVETEKAVSKQIKSMIQKLDIDASIIDTKTIKLKFLVNESDELIVLSTGDSALDRTIKNALNYKEVDTASVKYNKVYILPITFK